MRKRWSVWFLVLFLSGMMVGFGGDISAPLKAAKEDTYEFLNLFSQVLRLVEENYVEQKSVKDLIFGALKGMIKTLDPYSQFMEPRVYNEMKVETEGKYSGLGIRLTTKDEILTVVTPIEGTPAWKAGILPGDKIIKIENEDARGMSLQDAVEKLRGSRGSKVTISILREGEKELRDFTMEREDIVLPSVRSKLLEPGIGYVRIIDFAKNTDEDLKKVMTKLESEDKIDSFVLDLRNNPGGLLDIAVDVSKEFIGQGKMIVYTKSRSGREDRQFLADQETGHPNLPLVVLVNQGSASGSEIVAAAIQDHKRGVLLGTKTFGKGSVQTVFPLSDGAALRLTTAKYYTPSGKSIHDLGITPDIVVEMSREQEAKLMQKVAEEEGWVEKKKEDKKEEKKEEKKEDKTEKDDKKSEKKEPEKVVDVQLERAVDILKGLRIMKNNENH